MSAHGIHPAARRPGRLARAAVLVIPPLFVFTGWLVHRRWEYQRALEAIFGDAALGPYRRTAARLSYPPAAHHRPFSAPCQKDDCAPTLRHTDLARLERAGDVQGLAAAYALSGDHDRALKLLDTLPSTADVESDRAALLSHTPRRTADAFTAADRALRLHPQHPAALWNRALLMESLGLPLASARAFRAVEKLGEPGWSQEARRRAERVEAAWQGRVTSFEHGREEAERIKKGIPPTRDVLQRYPDLIRVGLIIAIRDHKTPALTPSLRSIAEMLDRSSGTTSLGNLVDRSDFLRKLPPLIQSGSVEDARQYQRLVEASGDPWFAIRGHQLLGRALIAAGQPKEGAVALARSLRACEGWRFPNVCLESKLWLAYTLTNQRDLQQGRHLAVEVAEGATASALPLLEADAHALLGTLEDLREQFALARAHAEQATLQKGHCEAANTGREQLAKIALAEGDTRAARLQLKAVEHCPGNPARFQMVGADALSLLAQDRNSGAEEFRWLEEAIRAHRAAPSLPRWHDLALRLFAARATLSRDRQRARAELEALLQTGSNEDEIVRMIGLQASSTLVVDAVDHGELAAALRALLEMQGVAADRLCVLGVASTDLRRAYVARGATGRLEGVSSAATPSQGGAPTPAVPPSILRSLAACKEVAVIATGAVHGQSRLLPDDVAWGYLLRSPTGERPPGALRRLVIWDVQPPPELGLQRLLAVPDTAPQGDHQEIIEQLRGPEATPGAARERMLDADLIEWHVHGLVDPSVSDAAALALSADRHGRSLLTAHDILGLRLERGPGVMLGACRGGLGARYRAFEWSLPLAFLRAGARWVIASPTPIEDAEGPAFFAAVWRRIVQGASPAIALRDERTAGRWKHSYKQWTRHVVLFD